MNKWLFLICTLLLCLGALLYFNAPDIFPERETIVKWFDSLLPTGILGAISLFLFLCIATAIGLPRQFAAFYAGYSYGLVFGVIIATLATSIGCFLTYCFCRYMMKEKLENRFEYQLTHLRAFFSEELFTKAIIIRLLPAGSNFITNVLAGVAKLPLRPFLLGSSLGYIPQMVVFTLIGSGVALDQDTHLYISAALLVTALLLIGRLIVNHQHKKRGLSPSL